VGESGRLSAFQRVFIMQSSVPTSNLFSLGVDLFGEVQRVIGKEPVRGLRVKIGNRLITEIPIAPLSTAATVALVLLAVVLSTLSLEIDHEPAR
jgi:hypothetical protein